MDLRRGELWISQTGKVFHSHSTAGRGFQLAKSESGDGTLNSKKLKAVSPFESQEFTCSKNTTSSNALCYILVTMPFLLVASCY